VLFPIGSANLDTLYGDNARRLDGLISWLDDITACDSLRVTSLSISGSSSPDGPVALNAFLAQERANALGRYVRNHVQLPDSAVRLSSRGIDWEALADSLENSGLKGREQALDIIYNQPELTYGSDGKLTDSRRRRLMDMNGGLTWREMSSRWFPHMRSASLTVAVDEVMKPVREEIIVESPEEADSVAMAAPRERKPFYMSVQTNMLYDALMLPTLGAEFYLGKGWSIAGNWTYGWWSSNKHHRYWRAYGGYLAGRKWFGPAAKRKPLTGHHAGVYAQLMTYDFEFGGKGQMAGTPGEPLWYNPTYAFGMEYGYSLPIARRLNIDFTIGVGYLGGKYYEYRPEDGHYAWKRTSRRNYFGPTNAQISLVWLIGNGNTNSREGGGE